MEGSKLKSKITSNFLKLKTYCEVESFKGWDPYDGLNSRVFQFLPFKHWDLARLAWIQAFKRSPINLRKILLVPKQHNAKGIGLFLSGYCNLYDLALKGETSFGSKEEILLKINELANLLDKLKNTNFSGACWGYNFPWQARRLFLFPKDTPTVVATSFCVEALFKAYDITKNKDLKNLALSAADFILNDLNRTPHHSGFLFSYSPYKGNNTVYNASLLGAKTLSLCYKYSSKDIYRKTALKAIKAACDGQETDGSWVYGLLPVQSWIDSFHTGYNLDSISVYQECTRDYQFEKNIKMGFDYYIQNFFQKDGIPKYFHNKTYPIDIHSPGQLFVTLSKLNKYTPNKIIANKVMDWTLKNMQSKKGYFYYQLKKLVSSKISYMRWSNAFMFNALTYYLKEESNL
jgi:hypothetical protein